MSRLFTLTLLLSAACASRIASGETTHEAQPAVDLTLATPNEAGLYDLVTDELAASAIAPYEEPLPTVSWTLRRGESLAQFARWADLPLEVVAETSGLSVTADRLPVGTVVRLPLVEGLEPRVTARRQAHHLRRSEGWLTARGGVAGVTFHLVATGETASSIARDEGELPVWLLESYNPTVDLEQLRPGQELRVPQLAVAVASSDPCGE